MASPYQKLINDLVASFQAKNSLAGGSALQTYLNASTVGGNPVPSPSAGGRIANMADIYGDLVARPDYSEQPGAFSRVVDFVSRPLYGVAGATKSVVDNVKGNEDADNPLSALWKGLSGEEHHTFGSAISAALPEDMDEETSTLISGIGGLAGDIVLDPLNIIAPVAGGAAIRGVRKISGARKGADAVGDIRPLLDNAQAAEGRLVEFIDPPPVPESILEITARGTSSRFEAGAEGVSDLGKRITDDLLKTRITDAVKESSVYSYPRTAQSPVFREARTTVGWVKDPAAQKAWVERYKSILSEEDFGYIQRARSPQEWEKRVGEVFDKVEKGRNQSIADFVIRAQEGTVPLEDINRVLDAAQIPSTGSIGHELRALDDLGQNLERRGVIAQAKTSKPEPTPPVGTIAKETQAAQKLDADIVARAQQGLKEWDSFFGAHGIDLSSKVASPATKANTIRQGMAIAEMIKPIREATYAEGLLRGPQVRESFKRLLAEIDTSEALNLAQGVRPVISSGRPADYAEWIMSMGQILKTLPSDVTSKALIWHPSSVMPSAIGSMVARSLDIVNSGVNISTQAARKSLISAGKAQRDNIGFTHKRSPKAVNKTIEDLADTIWQHRDRLNEVAQNNIRNFAQIDRARANRAVHDAAKSIDEISDVSKPTGSTTATIHAVADPSRTLSGIKDPKVKSLAQEGVAEEFAQRFNAGDTAAAKSAIRTQGAWKQARTEAEGARRVTSQKTTEAKSTIKEADDLLANVLGADEALHADRFINAQQEYIALKKTSPISSILGRDFVKAGEIGAQWRDGHSAFFTASSKYNSMLRAEMRAFSQEEILAAFNAIKNNSKVPAELSEAVEKLRPFVDAVVDVSGNDPTLGTFFRQQYSINDINQVFTEAGLATAFDLEAAVMKQFPELSQKALKDKISRMSIQERRALAADSWRELNVDDPLDFLSKLRWASAKLHTQTAVAEHFSAVYGLKNMPKGGELGGVRFKKIGHLENEADSVIWRFVDKNLYYPELAIDQLNLVESTLAKSMDFRTSSGMGAKFVNNVVDPFLAIWKPAATVMRPGHFVRNSISDFFLNIAGGVLNPRHYSNGMEILRAGAGLQREVALNFQNFVRQGAIPNPSGTYRITVKGGKEATYTAEDMYRMALQDGILPTFVQSEDIILASMQEARGVDRLSKRFMNTAWMRGMASINETSSHFFRITQYSKLMTDRKFTRKFNSLNEARKAAARETKRFHPDTTGLSPEEMKYFRRLAPFYSWTRQTIPVILETMVTHPQRITAVNKAIYNIGEMVGNEPESFGNPWPDHLLVPQFMRDNMGYIGGNMSFNLGTPTESMGDLFNGNIVENFLSMANPIAKAPVEMISGTRLGSEVPIGSKAEYIDRQIPGLSHFASISGYSPAGTLGNWMQGKFDVEPQRALEQGRKESFWNTSLANFFSGLSLADARSDQMQNIAAREIRRSGT